jgi:hypothetical protein
MMTGINNIDGDKDDIQSLVHAFMYQDKINIVGISSSTSHHQPGANDEKFINLTIDEYAKDYAKLAAKASGFKTASQLKSITYQGTKKLADSSGAPPATEGSNAIIKEAKAAKAAGEPLYVATWGGMAPRLREPFACSRYTVRVKSRTPITTSRPVMLKRMASGGSTRKALSAVCTRLKTPRPML